jgi:hypothetical protein
MRLDNAAHVVRTQWLVDGKPAAETPAGESSWQWPVERGRHTAQARVWLEGAPEPVHTARVEFLVK